VPLLRWIETLGAFVVGLSTSYYVSQLYGAITATVFSVLGFIGLCALAYCFLKGEREEAGLSEIRQTLYSTLRAERDQLKAQLEALQNQVAQAQQVPGAISHEVSIQPNELGQEPSNAESKQVGETPTLSAPQMPSFNPQPSMPDDKMTSMPTVKITRKEGELYELLKQRGKLKSAEIAGVVGRSQACVAVQLASLRKKGLVERDRDGFYYIKN
jgi:hypothetical protein